MQARAQSAERVVDSQNQHIATLDASNQKLIDTVVEMRRVGFGLLTDLEHMDLTGAGGSVAEDDEAAIVENPDLASDGAEG